MKPGVEAALACWAKLGLRPLLFVPCGLHSQISELNCSSALHVRSPATALG